MRQTDHPLRLHIGSGAQHLDGWVNVDIQRLPGVDVVADVTKGLPFVGAEAIYAEHFLEHLRLDQALDFLGEAHRVLEPGGWLRLSTPNLDWVWVSHYSPTMPSDRKVRAALHATRAFHGWGHQFLWNDALLELALTASGFEDLRWCRHGESAAEVFAGVERHRALEDAGGHHHVLIAEARKGPSQEPERLESLRELIDSELIRYLD
jgi:predicted SAM-dependent methyltransferase